MDAKRGDPLNTLSQFTKSTLFPVEKLLVMLLMAKYQLDT